MNNMSSTHSLTQGNRNPPSKEPSAKGEKPSKAPSKQSTSGRRAKIACDACRKRRTKCSGLPAPCNSCEQLDTFCHFHPRLDARRKVSTQTGDANTRRESILNGLLLALRLNSETEIQPLLDLLRVPTSLPEEMAESLRQQLCFVEDKTGFAASRITIDDILTLALPNVVDHRVIPIQSHVLSSTSRQVDAEDLSRSLDTSDHSTSSMPNSILSVDPCLLWNHPSNIEQDFVVLPHSHVGTPLDNALFLPITPLQTLESTVPGLNIPSFSTLNQLGLFQDPLLPESSLTGQSTLHGTDPQYSEDIFTFDHCAASNHSPGPPIGGHPAPIISDFARLCTDLRDGGRQLLARGITLDELGCCGPLDCDLLFRDRTPTDPMTTANWACEVARRLPPICASTRIALALSIFRVMPFLLVPSQSTWDLLPVTLRPTLQQLQHPHDITVSFLPIPILRTLIVLTPVDWFRHASQHDLRLEWPGVWGDVGGATLNEVGNWRETRGPLGNVETAGFTPIPALEDMDETEWATVKAITVDPNTGRRRVSEEFEQHCWDLKNWRFGNGILSVWPGLAEHLQPT